MITTPLALTLVLTAMTAAGPGAVTPGPGTQGPITSGAADPAREAQAKSFREASSEELLARGRASLPGLGTYRVRLNKRERIGNELQAPQTVQLVVREEPLAIRMDFLAGPVGRRVVYDSRHRPEDLRVHEHGFLGIVGARWVSIHSSLVHGDTNHPITDAGLGALLRLQAADLQRAKPFGGFSRADLGWNERDRWCVRYEAPAKGTGLYARASLVCLDPVTALPMEMTIWDQRGLLEIYLYSNLEPNLPRGEEAFDLQKAGL
jgi:Protein of unknown function (DUF1571)